MLDYGNQHAVFRRGLGWQFFRLANRGELLA
jgi:hypothetical protein